MKLIRHGPAWEGIVDSRKDAAVTCGACTVDARLDPGALQFVKFLPSEGVQTYPEQANNP